MQVLLLILEGQSHGRSGDLEFRPVGLYDGNSRWDLMLGLYDYPKTAGHPAFTLSLKVNFAEGAGENQAFRFVGPDGVITIGGAGVTLARRPRPKEPAYSIDTFPETGRCLPKLKPARRLAKS